MQYSPDDKYKNKQKLNIKVKNIGQNNNNPITSSRRSLEHKAQ